MEASTFLLFKQRKRIQELAKYYEAVLPHASDLKDTDEAFPKVEIEGFTPALPSLAADTQLTALAQLAACRTACQRGFISVIDLDAQHVVAEATRSISPFNQEHHDVGDHLLVGAQSLPLGYAICPVIFDIFRGNSSSPFEIPTNKADKDSVIIADLRDEARTKHLPIIQHFPPAFRYCVAVPLRTASGAVLGSICVVDSEPRLPDTKHVTILQDVARLVVQHMGDLRLKEDHERAERLLSGLIHFVQGQDSMSAGLDAVCGQDLIPTIVSRQARPSPNSLASLTVLTSHRQSSNVTGAYSAADHVNVPVVSTSTGAATTPSASDENGTGNSSVSSTALEAGSASDPASVYEQGAVASNGPYSDPATTIGSTFSRASNLIREAMDLDATTFLEVPHNYRFNNRDGRSKSKGSSDNQSSGASDRSTSESESLTDSSGVLHKMNVADVEAGPEKKILCRRLGFATKQKSSLIGSTVRRAFMTVSVALLTRLTRRYPEGKVFDFDSFGSISSGDDDTTAAEGRPPLIPCKNLAARLNRMFPDARSLIFLPLYDNDKQQLYAGFIGMTTCSTRVLQKHESTYVAAFTNNLMCEVMRREALTTDKAKSDFISSISHELRSPLHGILASSQLLAESKVQPHQMEYIQMVDTCTRTLLDITDHLLDHAKINYFTKQKEQRRQSLRRPKKPQLRLYSLVSSINMLSIIEDTASSMAASSHQMLQAPRTTRSTLDSEETLTVPILFDIPPQDIWKFDSEAGSWRRIIMNLIGNSLKYTQRGYIKVSFHLQKQSETKFSAELKVVDTGQGISEEYLKHRLYTPFTQENNLSVGVGLGLSLVNQIVASLRGEMRIFSEGGNGTEVSIKVPLTRSTGVKTQLPEEIDGADLLVAMSEQTFAFAGLDARPSLSEKSTGIPPPRMQALLAMKTSLSNLLSEWFGSQPVTSNASIVVVEESHLADNLKVFDRQEQSLLVIGLDGRQSSFKSSQIQHAAHVCLLAPIGPTKMASALKILLGQQKESKSRTLATSGLSTQRRMSAPRVSVDLVVPRPRTPGSDRLKEGILLVDDNDINLRILITCIKKLNLKDVELLTAVNGKEALDMYIAAVKSEVWVSVVFMDISMPVMNGFQSAREIRAFEKKGGLTTKNRTKIMALTGLASAEAMKEVEASGFDSYLRKPVHLRTIREVLTVARL